ncbi:hypothetical protein AB205_0038850 [Aquarana catesbeiana]|uniref:Uncharacterized protein n=1 Tax=Aquarana catesbeiana TaxID=8400 RepID=A0A2G9Q538_AQUCT|nr:hypothetical protein AB205_0038850 [Aquarana catesbeiana]
MWYYDRLHFLAGQTEPRSSLSSLPSTLPSPPAEASDAQPGPSRQQYVEEPSLSQGSLSQEVAGPSRLPDIQVPPSHLQRESGRNRSTLEEAAVGLFWKATEALTAPHTVEDFAGIIACKMQRMEEGQQLMCESLMLEALNKGLRGQITSAIHICDLTHGPPPPPGPTTPTPPRPTSPPPPPGPTPPPATSPTAEPQPGRKRGKKTRK